MTEPRRAITQCAMLVGGKGTRLGALAQDIPKPFLPCPNRPFLLWQMSVLARHGITDFVLLAGHKAHKVEAAIPVLQRDLPGVRIRVSVEHHLCGTGGALRNAETLLADRFLVVNGDTFLGTDYTDFLISDAEAAIMIRFVPDTGRYGLVHVDGKCVRAITQGNSRGGLVSTGIYAFRKSILDHVRTQSSLERDVLPRLIRKRELSYATAFGYFIDIGVPADFWRAQQHFSVLESTRV